MDYNTMQRQVILDKWMGLRAQTQKCSLIQIQRYNENKRNIMRYIIIIRKHRVACEDRGHILIVFVPAYVVGKNLNTPNWSSMSDDVIT